MFKAEEIILCISKASGRFSMAIHRYDRDRFEEMDFRYIAIQGANEKDWHDMTDYQRFGRLLFAMLDLVEFHGLPLRFGRDCLEDSVEGYREWAQGR